VAIDQRDALAHDAVGHRDGLLRVAGVVLDVEHDAPAVDPAAGVDGLGGFLGARHHLVSRGRHRTGARHRDRDADVVDGPGRKGGEGGDPGHEGGAEEEGVNMRHSGRLGQRSGRGKRAG